MRVAFVGVGIMGYPMAGHLKTAGHEVTVFNRTTATAEAWCEQYAGERAATPVAAAENAESVAGKMGSEQSYIRYSDLNFSNSWPKENRNQRVISSNVSENYSLTSVN